MASGFFCVTGPRHLEFRIEPGADDGVEGVIIDLQMMRVLNLLAQRFIGGETGRPLEGLLNRGQHSRRE
jgi:hypothetical protein